MRDNGQKNGVTRSAIARLRLIGLTFVAVLLGVPSALAQNTSIFGPNVYVFTPSMSASSINATLNTLNGNSQFSTNRYAVLFMPGSYTGVEAEVGYYESVAGLGETPSAVSINGGYLEANQSGGNSTLMFWRSLGNMSITPPSGTVLQWGVSQGISFRRMTVNGGMELTTSSCGYGSGGFISDTEITGNLNACDQQQWYTRNSSIGSWSGSSFNMVFSGVSGAPPQSFPSPPYTTLATTPVSREMPFLYVDSSANYWVFSPGLRTNSSGTSWSGGGMGTGNSLAISTFFIATPSSTLAQINAALASGQNLILTPGIYKYSGSINVVNANTVVLGLGYADLVPQTGTAAITVADVDGVQVAGVLIDAGPVNSPVLFEAGVAGGSRVSHASNPTSLNDVFFRIGGATAGTATTALEIDSDNVILDNIWAWRADHGTGVGWTSNVAEHGLVVNGDDVTALGLAVEHYEQNQVVWNGQGGETIFYQSELPYDVPSQSAWMDGSVDGYSSYSVSDSVTSHTAYGLGVYCLFNQGVNIVETSAITVPNVAGVQIIDAMTWFIGDSGSITHVVNSTGAAVNSSSKTSYLSSYGSSGGGCTAAPSVPGTPSATATSSSQINLTWGASTAGSSCTVSYNVFRSTTSGFTPSSSNQIATGVTTTSYSNTGLTASTTYYYKVEASDSFGSSATSAQASATTQSGGSGGSQLIAINAGGPAVSPFVADEDFSGGSTVSHANTINTSKVTNPAPAAVYQTGRDTSAVGPGTTFTYTIGGFTAGTNYLVRLHFCETYFTTAGSRTFNVSINGTQVLTNFDIFATAGGQNIANIQQFTEPANSSGQFVILFTSDVNNALISGIEIDSATCSTPTAPSGLTAMDVSSSQINLSWTASTAGTGCSITYDVFRGTTSGFTPSSSNEIASSVTATTYSDTGLTASTTYYYLVKAVDSSGSSAASNQASATTSASSGSCTSICIDSGSTTTVTPFVADEDFSGGATLNHANTINTSKVTNPAPAAVYQTARDENFT
ncbi:MAG: malectin domain-containing carbohydrate-binding protein, partial [Candidatus Acidiferrales bacterium]